MILASVLLISCGAETTAESSTDTQASKTPAIDTTNKSIIIIKNMDAADAKIFVNEFILDSEGIATNPKFHDLPDNKGCADYGFTIYLSDEFSSDLINAKMYMNIDLQNIQIESETDIVRGLEMCISANYKLSAINPVNYLVMFDLDGAKFLQ